MQITDNIAGYSLTSGHVVAALNSMPHNGILHERCSARRIIVKREKKVRKTVSLDESLIKLIDKARGDFSFSHVVNGLLTGKIRITGSRK